MSHGKLFLLEASPPVRAVLMTEKALGLNTEKIRVNMLEGEHMKPEYIKMNPQHTIPMYIDVDGTKVIDSHAINAYLVSKYGKDDSLYPKDLAKRSLVEHRLFYDASEVFPLMKSIGRPIMEKKATGPSPDQIVSLENIYEVLDRFLSENEWMAGKSVTIADFSLLASISSVNLIHPVSSKHAKLFNWLKKCEKMPFYAANVSGLEMFKGIMLSALGT